MTHDLVTLEPGSQSTYLIWGERRGLDVWVLPVLALLRAGLSLQRAKDLEWEELTALGFMPRSVGAHQLYRPGTREPLLQL